jgi:hypothetical protein
MGHSVDYGPRHYHEVHQQARDHGGIRDRELIDAERDLRDVVPERDQHWPHGRPDLVRPKPSTFPHSTLMH